VARDERSRDWTPPPRMQWCWIKRRFRLSAAPVGLPPSSEHALLSLGFDAAAQLAARRQHGCKVPAERTKESADELPSMLIWRRRHRIEGIMTSRLSKKEEKEKGIRSSRGTRETPKSQQETREGGAPDHLQCDVPSCATFSCTCACMLSCISA
jgi:hypothetical protein